MSLILDYWYLTPVCIVGATIAMSSGVGGPVFFTPLFILVLQLPPATAVAAALFTQLFGFLSGTFAYWRRRLIDMALARRLISVAAPAALLGSLLADRAPGPLLRLGFGIVAVLVGWRVYVSARSSEAPETNTDGRTRVGYRYPADRRSEGLTVAAIGATLLGMISVGLAELLAHHLVVRARIRPSVAVATNVCVTVVAVAAASTGHLYHLSVGSDADSLAQVGGIILFTVPGVLIGGQLGPIVQQRLRPAVVKRGIGVLLIIMGLVMFGTAL